MALNLYTNIRHEAERGVFLDYRDQMIDAEFYRAFLAGESKSGARSNANERMVRETARGREKPRSIAHYRAAESKSGKSH